MNTMTKYVLVAGASMPGINPQQGGELRSDPFGKGVKSYTGISGPAPFLSASCGPLVGIRWPFSDTRHNTVSLGPDGDGARAISLGPGTISLGPDGSDLSSRHRLSEKERI